MTASNQSLPATASPFQRFVATRNARITPHIAAIHDLCGHGNCSLGIALPVLSAGGLDANPVPTSILSCHTAYPSFTFLDTTSELEAYFENWRAIGVELSGVYTGFLGSEAQIRIIREFLDTVPDLPVVVDPVMGDHGRAYQTYTEAMCRDMKTLLPYADVLTPNLTEASILLDETYEGENRSRADGERICRALAAMSGGAVILKGMERGDRVYNGILDWEGHYEETSNPFKPLFLHGTGDLFASVLSAALFTGHRLHASVAFSGDIVYEAIRVSERQKGFRERGVTFEPLMGEIAAFCTGDADSL